MDDAELARQIEELERIENRVAAEQLRRLAEFDNRSASLADGARSAGDWAARRLHLTPGQGKTLADTALRLEDLPETADRFAHDDLAELDQHAAEAGATKDRTQSCARIWMGSVRSGTATSWPTGNAGSTASGGGGGGPTPRGWPAPGWRCRRG